MPEGKTVRNSTLMSTLLSTVLSVAPALGQEILWKIDEKTSSVEFSVKHLMVAHVTGHFGRFNGSIIYDGKELAKASVTANIYTASIDTNNSMRDHHLKAEDILATERFPVITFTSRQIVPKPDGGFAILGVLKMHGLEKEIQLNAAPMKPIRRDQQRKLWTGTTAQVDIDRKAFDIYVDKPVDKGGALVGEKVKVTLNINLVKADG